jgi:hypothetical protein
MKLSSARPAQPSPTPAGPHPADVEAADYQLEDDELLVRRAQQGDLAAFDQLIERYKQRLYATVYHMTSNHDDANDLLQDTFLKAYQHLK